MPYGVALIEDCLGCVWRESGLFCRLPAEALRQLKAIRQTAVYPPAAVLFAEGEKPRGLFILCSGEAKLTASSEEGRRTTLRLVQANEVLGLSSVVGNTPYPATAEILTAAQVAFVPRAQFLRFLQTYPEVGARVAEHLSLELHNAWEQMRLLSLLTSTRAKLAHVLLSWAELHGRSTEAGVEVPVHLTQEEIGETIGASRETVSRLLGDFKRRHLIRTKPGAIVLRQPEKLRSFTQGA
jgi:CRP/FNR family cyclic AMP-dependent transcriptional regulator